MANELVKYNLGATNTTDIGLLQPNVATDVISADIPRVPFKTKTPVSRFQSLFMLSDLYLGATPQIRHQLYPLFSLLKIESKAEADAFLYTYQCMETYQQYNKSGDPAYKAWVDSRLALADQLTTDDGGLSGLANRVVERLLAFIQNKLPTPIDGIFGQFKQQLKAKLLEKLSPYIKKGEAFVDFAWTAAAWGLTQIITLRMLQAIPVVGQGIDQQVYNTLINGVVDLLREAIETKLNAIMDELIPREDPTTQAKVIFVAFWKSIGRGAGSSSFASRFGQTRTLSNVVFNPGQDMGDYKDEVSDSQILVKIPKPFAYTTTPLDGGRERYEAWAGQQELVFATLAWAPNLAATGAIAQVIPTIESLPAAADFDNQSQQNRVVQFVKDAVKQLSIIATSSDLGRVERMDPFTRDSTGTQTGPLKFANGKLTMVMSGPKCLRQTYMEQTATDDAKYIERVKAFQQLVAKKLELVNQNAVLSNVRRNVNDPDATRSAAREKAKTDATARISVLESEIAAITAANPDLETFMKLDYGVLDQLVPYLICPSYTSSTQTDCGATIDQSPTGLLGRFCAYLDAILAKSKAIQAVESRNKLLLWVLGAAAVGGGGFYLWHRHQKKKQLN